MQIKVWGCRGSLSTPGADTIRYGGNTTCLEIRLNDGTLIVVDAGSGIRALGDKLLQEQGLTEMYLFLTHAHIDTAEIEPIPLSPPGGGYGLKLIDRDRVFVFLTDNGLGYAHEGGLSEEDHIQFCEGSDLLIHDAQYTEHEYMTKAGWGHSTFASATELAILAGVRRLDLCHHDPDHSDDDLDRFAATCRERSGRQAATWTSISPASATG